jgi:plasmid stability protein
MASITIRNLDDALKTRLRVRAAERGRSMEEEARRILRDVLDEEKPRSLADLALAMFGAKHGVALEPHPPVDAPAAPLFEDE